MMILTFKADIANAAYSIASFTLPFVLPACPLYPVKGTGVGGLIGC